MESKTGSTRVVRCRICGRWLTNPVSVDLEIGPVCRTSLLNEAKVKEADG